MASLGAEPGLLGVQDSAVAPAGSAVSARGLQRADPAAVAHGLSSPEATWFPLSCPNQGLNQCPLHWQAGS